MHPEALQRAVLDDLEAWAAGLGPTLASAWATTWQRLRLDEGRGYFLHPLALPVLELPAWVAAGPAPAGAEAVRQAAGSAAAGYLHVRLRDDLLDEGIGGGPSELMLGEALLARHHRLAAELAGHCPAFHALAEARWQAYAEAMALEASLPPEQPVDAALFTRLLDRSAPLAIPPAALLLPTRPELAAPLCDMVDDLARSHQLFTDAIDAERDLRNGNRSHVLERMGVAQGPAEVRRRLYMAGGLDQVVGEAVALVEAARARATAIGLHAAGPWLDARLATMERIRQEAFAALFRSFLGTS